MISFGEYLVYVNYRFYTFNPAEHIIADLGTYITSTMSTSNLHSSFPNTPPPAAHHYSLVTVPLDQHGTASALTSVLALTGMTVIVVTLRTLPVTLAAVSEPTTLAHVIV